MIWSENPGDIVNLSGPDKSNSNSSEKGKYKFSNYVFLSTFYAQSFYFIGLLQTCIFSHLSSKLTYINFFTIKKQQMNKHAQFPQFNIWLFFTKCKVDPSAYEKATSHDYLSRLT